jgi:hypothetical protein
VPENVATAFDGSDQARVHALARAGAFGVAALELTGLRGP